MKINKIINEIKKEKEVLQGKRTKDKVYSSQVDYDNEETAKKEFQRSKEKLFDVNRWSELPGITSTFVMYDAKGNKKASKMPEVGDYMYIDLPGPTPENWVEVIAVADLDDIAELVVSPSPNPNATGEDAKKIKHFFIEEATSTYRVERKGTSIFAAEIGLEEGINMGEKSDGRGLINAFIAEGGWAVFQKVQWQKLTDYLVHKIEIKDDPEI